jgi:hypothetical protein
MERPEPHKRGHASGRDQPDKTDERLGHDWHLHQRSVDRDRLPFPRLDHKLKAVRPRTPHQNAVSRANTHAHDRRRSRLAHRIVRAKVEAQRVLGIGAAEGEWQRRVAEVVARNLMAADAARPGYLGDHLGLQSREGRDLEIPLLHRGVLSVDFRGNPHAERHTPGTDIRRARRAEIYRDDALRVGKEWQRRRRDGGPRRRIAKHVDVEVIHDRTRVADRDSDDRAPTRLYLQ